MFSGAAVASLHGWVKVSGTCFKMHMIKVILTKVKDILGNKFENRTFNVFVLNFSQLHTSLFGNLIKDFLVLTRMILQRHGILSPLILFVSE